MELPIRILRPFLGARIIKTGLAVFLSLAAFHWIGPDHATFAAVAAILAVQPSVSRAKSVFLQQLLGNLVAGTVAAILGLWLGKTALGMALGVVVALGICTRLKLTEAAGLAVFAVLYIMDRPTQDFLLYTAARVAVITTGMLIGYLVNRFVIPPNFTARIRQEIASAQAGIEEFGTHLLASLASPEHYDKEQIKAESASIRHHLETASYFLDLYQESNPSGQQHLPLEKARASLYVFMERITDIHKIVLQAGGLMPGPELGAVATALKAVMRYRAEVLAALLEGRLPAEAPAVDCHQATDELKALVDQLVDRREVRGRGLTLHSILTNIRHMSWRMDALASLLREGSLPPDR